MSATGTALGVLRVVLGVAYELAKDRVKAARKRVAGKRLRAWKVGKDGKVTPLER